MEEDVEVLFEAPVLKLTGLDRRSAFRLSSQWKKRYLILIRERESASLLYYSHKPSSLNSATPKGTVVLEPYYRVEKKHNVRGQHYVVSLTTPSKRLVIAMDDERIFHLLAFYLQVQVKLNEEVEEECFVVRPDNSDDQRKIGARGNMCLLHVSQSGVTVALQLSKCVIVQWPLTCIRNYESTGRGQFLVTVGKRASMGVGRYVFNTRLSQDNVIYDRLDRYVIDAAGLRHSHADSVSQTSLMEQESLHALTYVQANPQFSNHLRKISREIYDSLWQHLGSTRLKASSPDLVADSPHARQRSFPRTGSMGTLDGAAASVPTTPRQSLRRKLSSPSTFAVATSPLGSPNDFSSLPRNFRRTPPAKVSVREKPKRIPVEMIESEYLHPDPSHFDEYDNDPGLQMQVPTTVVSYGSAAKVTGKPPVGVNGRQGAKSPHTSISSEPAQSPSAVLRPGERPRLQRLQSRSCEDLIAYMDMSTPEKQGNHYVYNNGTFETSGDAGSETPDDGKYSYATQDEIQETRAAAQKLAKRRLYSGSVSPNSTQQCQDSLPTGYIRKPLTRQSSMKKAMSNPSLIEQEQGQDPDAPPMVQPASRPPLPSKYQQSVDRTPKSSGGSPVKTPSPMTSVPMKSLGGAMMGGASPLTSRAHSLSRPKGIHATSKTKVFRKPNLEEGSSGAGGAPQNADDRESEQSRRQGSVSSGYASGGNTEQDMRETHC